MYIKFAIAAGLLCGAASFASAASPPAGDPIEREDSPRLAVPLDTVLDREVVVRNWVLCVSPSVAERLVQARATDSHTEERVYNELLQAKLCGRFAELTVILQENITGTESGSDIYAALVQMGGNWAAGFVVSDQRMGQR